MELALPEVFEEVAVDDETEADEFAVGIEERICREDNREDSRTFKRLCKKMSSNSALIPCKD